MLIDWKQLQVNYPEGSLGAWTIQRFSVSKREQELQELRCAFNPQRPRRVVPAGTYTGLYRNGTVVMSDTPDEICDHWAPIMRAPKKGACLIGGLGLGVVAKAMLDKSPKVKVTVIELCPEVIELVGTHLKAEYGDRLEIIQADVMDWKPPRGAKYDVVWFDIFDNIDMDNLEQMATLNRRYAQKAVWKGCWQQGGCVAQRERIKSGRGWY